MPLTAQLHLPVDPGLHLGFQRGLRHAHLRHVRPLLLERPLSDRNSLPDEGQALLALA